MAEKWTSYREERLCLNWKDIMSIVEQLKNGSRFLLDLNDTSAPSTENVSFTAKSRVYYEGLKDTNLELRPVHERAKSDVREYHLTNDGRRELIRKLQQWFWFRSHS